MTSLVKKQRSGAVVTIVLNRPHRHNSLVPELLEELKGSLDEVAGEPTVRAVVLAAEGRSFSTGGDVAGFFAASDLPGYAARTVGLLNEVMVTMLQLEQPIVAAVNGMVTGGSLGLVLASDVVLVTPQVTFTPWYAAVGFSPDGGWTSLLPDLIGVKRTAALILQNRSITATEALAWGIATEIAAADEIEERAATIALDIAEMDPGAVSSSKRLLAAEVADVAVRLEAERQAFVEQVVSPEARKGMAAFLGRER